MDKLTTGKVLTAFPDKISFCANVILLERTCILDSVQESRHRTYMLAGNKLTVALNKSKQITNLLYTSRLILLGAGNSDSNESACSTGHLSSIHGQEDPWKRHVKLLQYSCLENPHGQRSLAGFSPRGRQSMGL